jgi:hypothetical protein
MPPRSLEASMIAKLSFSRYAKGLARKTRQPLNLAVVAPNIEFFCLLFFQEK